MLWLALEGGSVFECPGRSAVPPSYESGVVRATLGPHRNRKGPSSVMPTNTGGAGTNGSNAAEAQPTLPG